MRIISGQFRRTPITVVVAPGLRPTPDRVRETAFNWIEQWIGDWKNIHALDLFAGSGALGWECASRGAQHVTLVERHPSAVKALKDLRERLQCGPQVSIDASDWKDAIRRLPPASLQLVFLDPPFDAGYLPEAIAASARLLCEGGLLYVESGQEVPETTWKDGAFERLRNARAGAVFYYLLRRHSC